MLVRIGCSNVNSILFSQDHIEVRDAQPLMGAGHGGKVITATDLPQLRFLYWYVPKNLNRKFLANFYVRVSKLSFFSVSCGYKQAFDQFSSFVKSKYPNMEIEGGNYPPASWKAYAAQVA